MSTQVVILAAGRGSRFGERDLPKALLALENGQCLLEHQLGNLSQYCRLDTVNIVVGFHQEAIRTLFPNLTYIENRRYAEENTSKSLLRALEHWDEADLLWLNGDVVFRPRLLGMLLGQKKTAMLVNKTEVGEEEVKYSTDDLRFITEVSKKVSQPVGEAIGINFFAAEDVPQLIEGLKACQDSDYFEAAIERCIQKGLRVSAVECGLAEAVEVDFLADLGLANQRLREWAAGS